jgi:hypothetical protein
MKEIYYEDIINEINDGNIRDKLINLVKENKIIVIKGLTSGLRHRIYRQMYYPLKFEKIIVSDTNNETIQEIDIKIYNYKIKSNKNKENTEYCILNNKLNNLEDNKTNNTEDKNSQDTYSENTHSDNNSDSDLDYQTESSDSYYTDEDEQITRLEDIGSQVLERVSRIENKVDKTQKRVNLIIFINIIGWIMLYTLDPVRLIQIKNSECEIY